MTQRERELRLYLSGVIRGWALNLQSSPCDDGHALLIEDMYNTCSDLLRPLEEEQEGK